MEIKDFAASSPIEEQEHEGGLLYGFAHLLLFIFSAPFLAIRQVYWWFDTDAAVRANGVETTGTVLSTETETRTQRDEGGEYTVTEYFVTYRYETPEGSYTARKKVGRLGGLNKDSKIVTYYRRPTDRLPDWTDSALDWNPRLAG